MTYQVFAEDYYYKEIRPLRRLRRSGDLLEFESVEAANDYIDELESGTYLLDHNEYARPNYYVINETTAQYITTGRGHDMSNYDWGQAACDCGECQECLEMMTLQDVDYLFDNAL